MIGPRIEQAWRQAAGDLAGDSRVVSVRGGVVTVLVQNSVLLHELSGFRKAALLQQLQQRLPELTIAGLRFRIGQVDEAEHRTPFFERSCIVQNQVQPLPPAAADRSANPAMVEAAIARQMQEVQAAATIARKFPRDEGRALERILASCRRRGLAEEAQYAYPRGGQTVTGPSIRLAEALAQNWGNLDFGIVELEQRQGDSTVMAFCWDLETNVRQLKTFTVRHWRQTKQGGYPLTDPRDVYELIANHGARRLRACILGIIPGDIVDAAVAECECTLAQKKEEPLGEAARKMVQAFGRLGITAPMLEKRLGHALEEIEEAELTALRKTFIAIKEGGAVEEYFGAPASEGAEEF
jgi:hypothetical protein